MECPICLNKYNDTAKQFNNFIRKYTNLLSNILNIPEDCSNHILEFSYGCDPFKNIEVWEYEKCHPESFDMDYDLNIKNVKCCTHCLSERIWFLHKNGEPIPSIFKLLKLGLKKNKKRGEKFLNNNVYYNSNTYICDGYMKPPLYTTNVLGKTYLIDSS